MNKMKTFITAVVLMLCLVSLHGYAAAAFNENETPFLPTVTDDKQDEASNNNQAEQSTSNPTNPGSSSGGSSYKPSTKPNDTTEPTQTENHSKTFTDIKPDDWFYNDVMFVFDNQLMTGTSESAFSPNITLNRAMMITILHRMDGDDSMYEKDIFHDVEKNSWYENAVNWGYENKIVSGTSENTFAPMNNLTREQLCVMLYHYTEHIGVQTEFADISSYSDHKTVSDWAKDAVSWAVQEKIITGKGNNTLAPKDSATRAEAAAVIRRYTEKFAEIGGK